MKGVGLDVTQLTRGTGVSEKKRLEAAAQQFESMLLEQIVKDAVPKPMDGEGSFATETYGEMMGRELAQTIAESGTLGLAKVLTQKVGARLIERDNAAPRAHDHDHAVTSGFGARRDPITGVETSHGGVDVRAATGTPLVAPSAGRVASITRGGNGGLSVTLDHGGGRTTTYRHLDEVLVREGDRVEAGGEFARTGASGRVTGPHVHVEARDQGKLVDPTPVVGRIFSR